MQTSLPDGKHTRVSLEQGNTEESEVPPDSERDLIAGQRLSVIRSILQKMLSTQATPGDMSQINWDRHEMLALTEIFKTIVHSEIEQRQQTALTVLSHSSNDKENSRKLNKLEEQNKKLTEEVELLKLKLEKSACYQSPSGLRIARPHKS